MVINNLDIFWPIWRPHKAHAKLIVDADAVLSGTITFQRLQPIAGWHPQIVENSRPIKLCKFSPCHRLDVRESLYALPTKQALRIGALEGLDGHKIIVTQRVMDVKRDCPPCRLLKEWLDNQG